jgi:glycosyltransferase involved in cell wall biosynthesis
MKDAPMKILHTMAGGQAGGAEMAYVDLLVAQKRTGMDVVAACRPNKQRVPLLKDAGIPVYELPFGGAFDFKTKKALRHIIQNESPDIVQCWMSRASKLTPKVEGTPKIARLGGYYNLKYYTDVDHFIGNTPDICRWLVEDKGVPKAKVTHINNFAELEPIATPVIKADFQTADNAFVFLAMARLHKVKGIDTALQALALVPDAVLWIAGDGPEEKALKKLAVDLGVADRVRWLGWRTDRSALLDVCDAVLFPSRFEPFGGTFAQAWAAKKPLVTTASEGPSQYVTHERDALVSPINNVDELADNMTRVMQDKFLCRGLVREGFTAYQSQFTIKKVIKSYDSLYKSLKNLT